MTVLSKEHNESNEIKKLRKHINLDDLPEELKISTITATCMFETLFNTENIGKYLSLSENRIIRVKYGNGENAIIRSIADSTDKITKRNRKTRKPRKQRKKSKKEQAFYNQVTIVTKCMDTNSKVNIKLFQNGAVQMTGCKGFNSCMNAFNILCNDLKIIKAVVNDNKLIQKPFVTNHSNLSIDKLQKFQIQMINSNFDIGFQINRDKLYGILLNTDIDCSFEPDVHAAVNIKYIYTKSRNTKNPEKISIFVFESGQIIITGAKHKDHIIDAYKYIAGTLYENYTQIVRNDLDKIIASADYQNFLISVNA